MAKKSRTRKGETVAEKLRRAAREYGTVYRLARDTGITYSALYGFVTKGLDLRLETASELAQFLGMELSDPVRSRPADDGDE